jgi:hypothetical protein
VREFGEPLRSLFGRVTVRTSAPGLGDDHARRQPTIADGADDALRDDTA